jgi:hypothetical protein
MIFSRDGISLTEPSPVELGQRIDFQDGCSYDEIIRWLPSLTHEEIAVVERYYRQHRDELDEYERRVQDHRAEQVQSQRLRFPERKGDRHERLAQLRQLLQQRHQESDGEGTHR